MKLKTENKKQTKIKQQSIGREKAIKLAASKWWEGKTPHDIAKFQLFTAELAMPFDVFQESLEKALGRPVFTHELGLNLKGIMLELLGEADAPSLEEIINLIPAKNRIIIATK